MAFAYLSDTFVTNSILMKASKLIFLALLLFLQAAVTCVFAQDYDGREYFCLREKWGKPETPKEGEIIPPIYNILADDYICGYTVNGMWGFYPYGIYLMRDNDGYMMVLKYYCDDDQVQSDTIRIDSKLANRLHASVKKTLKRAVKNTTIPWSEMGSPNVTVFTKKMAADRTIDQIPDSLWLEQYLKFNHTPVRPRWAPKPISDEEMEEFLRQGGQIIEMDTTWFYLVPAGAQQSNNMENGHEYVDLGLNVKWATCNVGAIAPEGYGDFFAWGEIEPYYDAGLAQDNPQTHWKDNKAAGYDMSTYKYCKGSTTTLTKYCNRSEYGYNGFVDNKTTLDPEDDVAHVKWGGSWRMPTKEELEELRDSCTWVFTTRNNVKGYVISSNKPGYTERSIFLPTAGNRIDINLYNVGVEFGLWSNSINTDRPGLAWILSYKTMDYIGRGFGFSVRPVCPK